MASPWRAFLVLIAAFTLFSMVGVNVEAQAARVRVSSDLQLLSLGTIDGGGHFTLTFSGDAAKALRQRLIWMYDGMTPEIARGFPFYARTTGANGDGTVSLEEATNYMIHLENQYETAFSSYQVGPGTPFRYVSIYAADRSGRDLPADRSSTGLVGSRVTDTANLEMSFLFNGKTTVPADQFDEPDVALVDGVFGVFSFSAREDLTTTGCAGFCWPFPAIDGWRLVDSPANASFGAGRFLWMGDAAATPWVDLGAYPDNANRTTFTSGNGATPGQMDLRFATTANLTFEHTGSAAADDRLSVQASPDGIAWQNLTDLHDGDGDPDTLDAVPTSRLALAEYDLTPYLGQQPYLRIRFAPNNDGTTGGPGYFLRDLWVNAPSTYVGSVEFHHTDYVVGFLSFQDFQSAVVKPHVIRTPVGEVLFYNADYNASAMPADTARYAMFDFVENPQILFVVLVVCAWLIGLFQDRFWEAFRRKTPAAMRSSMPKTKWLHWSGRVVDLVLVLFYFFPTILGGNFIGGATFWILALASTLGLVGFTWFWYDRKAKLLPPEPEMTAGERLATDALPPPPPSEEVAPRVICAACDHDIEDPETAYKCGCGQVYHVEHATQGTCGNCGRLLQAAPPPEKRMLTVKCPTCEEVNVVEEGVELTLAKCTSCNGILKEIPKGYNYLLIADEPHVAYEWFASVVRQGGMGLCMSTTFPEKLRREYGLPEVELYWLSDTNPGPRTLDPKRLDFEIMRALSNFVKGNKGGAIVLDGLEYLIVENSFDRVLKFIKKVNDLASVHDVTMFAPVTPTGLGPEEMTLLRKEFDKVETIAATKQ